jgi:hypothetical protein
VEAYNNFLREKRRLSDSPWCGKSMQPITRTVLELAGNSKADEDKPALRKGMLWEAAVNATQELKFNTGAVLTQASAMSVVLMRCMRLLVGAHLRVLAAEQSALGVMVHV